MDAEGVGLSEEEDDPVARRPSAPRKKMLEMFEGNHAKVLVYYMELGNFKLKLKDDVLIVVPRVHKKNKREKTVGTFRTRFGRHFRAIGFTEATRRQGVPFVYRSYSRNPLDLETLAPPRDRDAENIAMLETDMFA